MTIELLASVAVFLLVLGVMVFTMTPAPRVPRISWTAGQPVRGLRDEAHSPR